MISCIGFYKNKFKCLKQFLPSVDTIALSFKDQKSNYWNYQIIVRYIINRKTGICTAFSLFLIDLKVAVVSINLNKNLPLGYIIQ